MLQVGNNPSGRGVVFFRFRLIVVGMEQTSLRNPIPRWSGQERSHLHCTGDSCRLAVFSVGLRMGCLVVNHWGGMRWTQVRALAYRRPIPMLLDGFEEEHTEAAPSSSRLPPQYGLELTGKMLFGAPEGSQDDEEKRRKGSIWGFRRSLNRQNRYKVRRVTHFEND